MVMARTARTVSGADALSYVSGYCVGNALWARDLQQRTSQWMIGKSLDGFAPIGPYLVTADQVPDPNALALDTKVNGEVRQSSNTSDMVYNCKQLIAYASKMFTLRPGDLIFTGTPEGVIAGYPKDKQVWLKPGDTLTNRIDKLGELAFTLGQGAGSALLRARLRVGVHRRRPGRLRRPRAARAAPARPPARLR